MTPAPFPGPQQAGPDDKEARTLWEAQRAALAEAFPTWKIVCVAHLTVPLWFALYREPLTLEQERAGFRPTILRDSAETLQAELALRCRPTRLPLPLPHPPPKSRYSRLITPEERHPTGKDIPPPE